MLVRIHIIDQKKKKNGFHSTCSLKNTDLDAPNSISINQEKKQISLVLSRLSILLILQILAETLPQKSFSDLSSLEHIPLLYAVLGPCSFPLEHLLQLKIIYLFVDF